MRAAARNALIQERVDRARARRQEATSHILRRESAELAAKAAIWRAHYMEKPPRTARVAERAMSARSASQPHLPNGYARRPLRENDDAQHRHAHVQGKALAFVREHTWRKGPVDLEFYRPPPVLVPSDDPLCYLY